MKNIFLEEQPNLNKVIIGLTFILLFCAIVMRAFGIYPRLNIGASFTLGIFCFLSFFIKKNVNSDSYNLFLATLIVGDAMYLLSLFFLLGRTFIKYL